MVTVITLVDKKKAGFCTDEMINEKKKHVIMRVHVLLVT